MNQVDCLLGWRVWDVEVSKVVLFVIEKLFFLIQLSKSAKIFTMELYC